MNETKAKSPGRMKLSEYIAYACGEGGYTMQNTIIASYMVMYFTNAVGINAMVIGTMTLVCRIVDAFTDIGFGALADRTNTRLGKFKPWYMCSVIPTCIAFLLLFFVPGSIGSGSAMAVLWMYIMYILWGSVFGTIDYTWLNAAPAVSTADPRERRNMSTWRQWAASAIGVVVSYTGVNLIIQFNIPEAIAMSEQMGGEIPPQALAMNFRHGYMMMGLIVGGISLVLFIVSAIFTQERVKAAPGEKASVSFKEGFKAVKGNRLLWGALLCNCMMFVFATMTTGITSYFYQSYYGNPQVIATVMGTGGLIGLVFNTVATPILNQKFTKDVLHVIASAGLILGLAIIFLGAPGGSLVPYIVGWSIFQSMIQLANVLFFRTVPEAIDYGEWKNGVYAPGIISSIISFFQKVGMGLAAFLLTAVLTLCGLQEGAMMQTPEFASKIHVAYLVVPSVCVLLTFIGYFIVRSVPKSEMLQMRRDLAEKRGVEFDEKTALN